MGLALKSTSIDPYCPLRATRTSELRGCPPALVGDSSSESTSELPDISSGDSSETIETLLHDLGEVDYTIDLDPPPETLDEAARRLDLGAPQSAKNRLDRLIAGGFPKELLKNSDGFTSIGWEYMKKLQPKGKKAHELWAEYKAKIKSTIVEPESEPETVDVEIMDDSEIGAAIVLRTEAILATIQDVPVPTIVLGQHQKQLLAHYKAAGSQFGLQLGGAYQSGVVEGFQSAVTQGTVEALK